MNDDEKKPVESEDGATANDATEQIGDTKVEVKFGKSDDGQKDTESSRDSDDAVESGKELDITAALDQGKTSSSLEGDDPDEPEEEVSELDRELERVEGIESADTGAMKQVDEASAEHDTPDDDTLTAPVDLDKSTPETATLEEKDNPVVVAIRKQEHDKKKSSGGKASLVSVLLGVLLLAAAAGAGYFYWVASDNAVKLSTAESELTTSEARSLALQKQLADTEAKSEDAASAATASSEYTIISELGVRYKQSDATKDLLFGYTVASADTNADAVAVSTKQLVKLAVGSGASVAYPCGFSGNVPTIARYTTDVQVNGQAVSTVSYTHLTLPTSRLV